MKKLLLFLSVSALSLTTFTACSDDDAAAATTTHGLSFKVNGQLKTFENVYVDQVEDHYTGQPALEIWAENGDNNYFTFTTRKGDLNAMTFDYGYEADNKLYVPFENTNEAFEINTDGHIKGTFSGTWYSAEGDEEIVITEGKYDIEY